MLKSAGYFQIIALITVLFSCLLVAYSTWCGPGFTFDSHDYFAASRSWRVLKELINENGSLYVFHAPLFPIFLSFIGSDFNKVYFLLNIAVCCISGTILYFSTRKLFEHHLLHVIYFASIILSVGFQMIHHFLWTESIFLLLFIVHNFFLIRFLNDRKRQDYMLLVLFAFLMGLFKNTGFFILMGSALVLLLQTRKKAFRTAAMYGVFGAVGFVAWNVVVVLFRDGNSIYTNSNFLKGVSANVYNYADVISLWFIPSVVPTGFRIAALVLLILLLFFITRKAALSKELFSYIVQVAVYLTVMIVVIKVDYDEIERLLAIIAPWFMLGVFMTVDLNWVSFSTRSRQALLMVLVLFLSYTLIRSYKNVGMWHRNECKEEKPAFYQDNTL